ncbi:hypothetical protein [Thiolapillus brandeum]|uniref:Uncharacterized protein n=1 Tax=Thiolapillus brandeum TaxID=1076588 RepID=A0A7U6GHS6_9GAMM|nr:hypothetical protein [Thiolapillus brandeum]BAO43891.1 hypothetical protein TBH_C0961 [Thiolapillus brandeum]
MDSRYHTYRRHVLQARAAFIHGAFLDQIADHLLQAGRELAFLLAEIPPGVLREKQEEMLIDRVKDPSLQDALELLALSSTLTNSYSLSRREDEEVKQRRWQRAAWLLEQMDVYLEELAGAMNEQCTGPEAVPFKGSASSVQQGSGQRDV